MNILIRLLISGTLLFITSTMVGQHTDANIFGDVQSRGEHVPFVNIYIEGTTRGTATDHTGHYMLIDLPPGEHVLVAQAIGYKTAKREVVVEAGRSIEVNFVIEEELMSLHEVVVTGTKTFKRSTESAIIVNVLDSKIMNAVQASNISEGLQFQPGLRVETDCQTCNYTQLRMNGLGGGYSQILINGRPIFSPLTGLYGMEQIPANMVDRIEVVRGGGSALYGSSAIGGTVNIITRIPAESDYDFSYTGQSINGGAFDNILSGNINVVNEQRTAGTSVFVNMRQRAAYDHNGDNYSELPELKNNSFGANMFFKPTHNQKLELNITSLYEYRYGGEMVDDPAFMVQQSEERTHNVFMGGLDYQLDFNGDRSAFILYAAGQYTGRDHYTGILPDDPVELANHFLDPPYGYTTNSTLQGGTQVNHRIDNFLTGENVITFGAEYLFDDVFDTIPAYNYEIDQVTSNAATYLQSDWKLNKALTLLTGVRLDKHNLVDHIILSPRVSLLYRLQNYMQFRLTWGTGFRAPQAFDADMHIAFAAGGVSRIILSPDLAEERSNSLSGSINYDKATERFIAGFTMEGFYTSLNNAFALFPLGEDVYGQVYEKRNATGATVAGATLELRGNYNQKVQMEAGYTLQSSMYDETVVYSEDLDRRREFLRTPNQYGYMVLTWLPSDVFNASASTVYTGPMELIHLATSDTQTDEYRTSPSFLELNLKAGYTFTFRSTNSGVELFGGVKNVTNAYQEDLDSGKNRDSNYVYGPGAPRTIYMGIRVKSL
ncbi:MAG: TonB-dependent receptor [Bacteroidales bacterium]